MIEREGESGKGMPMASGVCAREGMVESGEGAGDVGCGSGRNELTGRLEKRTKGRRGEESVVSHGPANRPRHGTARGGERVSLTRLPRHGVG